MKRVLCTMSYTQIGPLLSSVLRGAVSSAGAFPTQVPVRGGTLWVSAGHRLRAQLTWDCQLIGNDSFENDVVRGHRRGLIPHWIGPLF